jgi:hypothetical protein
MRQIIYYVATSIDGFICGPAGDISGFIGAGNGIQKYLGDLSVFDTVIMGRNNMNSDMDSDLNPDNPRIQA